MKNNPISLESLLAEANDLLQQGELTAALAQYDRCLEIDADCLAAYLGKLDILDQQKENEQLLTCATEAITKHPNCVELWVKKGRAYGRKREYEEALICYDKALSLNPNLEAAWSNKGVCLERLQDYQEAIFCYDKALSLNPTLEAAWNNKGVCLESFQDYQEAIFCYDKALSLNPTLEEAWNNKGLCFFRLSKLHQADVCFSHVLKRLNSENTLAWLGFSILYILESKTNQSYLDYLQYDRLANMREFNEGIFNFLRKESVITPFLTQKYLLHHPNAFLKDSPQAVYRTISQCQTINTCIFYQALCNPLKERQQYLNVVSIILAGKPKEAVFFNSISTDFLLFLMQITYYMNDPLTTYQLIDEMIEERVGDDLQVQYYFCLAAQLFYSEKMEEWDIPYAFNEDYIAISKYALQQAEQYRQETTSIVPKQMYYAGQLFLQQQQVENALACFQACPDFLPAQYMALYCLDELEQPMSVIKEQLDQLLEQERALKRAGTTYSYLFPEATPRPDLDLSANDASILYDFCSYASYKEEIQDALLLVYRLCEQLAGYATIPFSDTYRHFYESWTLSEGEQGYIKQMQANYAKELLGLAWATDQTSAFDQHLITSSESIFRDLLHVETKQEIRILLNELRHLPEDLLEARIAQLMIERPHVPPEAWHQLVFYYFFDGKLQASQKLCLDTYITVQRIPKDKLDVLLGEVIGDVIKTMVPQSVAWTMGYLFLGYSFGVSLLAVAGGAVVSKLFTQFLERTIETNHWQDKTYADFKAEVYLYLGEQKT